MKPVGKRTPVWRHRTRGEVVCGPTLTEALNVGPFFPTDEAWEQVKSLPNEQRVVISNNAVLPKNDITLAVAATAEKAGPVHITAYGRQFTYDISYVDSVKVIIK